ncbi:N-acetylmuramoyl-L-alanine amidase family protein [Altererythrobacter sp. Z27]|uniref:N-acetylmuramoyl-L-alanine amidase family protein n=1 Tax=Altererythrobacter sp. Z27 TaxID=3461147 RepID=UPI004043D878
MSLRTHLVLIVMLPLILVGGLVSAGIKLPVPQWGRDYVLRLFMPELAEAAALPGIYGPADPDRPLVVIDAGHGGRDPGAVGAGIREKDVTLGLALALRDALVRQGGVRVALTREDDRLLALAERPDIARRMGADLFVSIHADSAGEKSGVSGASLYTLSARASSAAAARFARRENDADRLNGLSIDGQSEQVSAILVELSQRRSQTDSLEFASLVTREGAGQLTFHPQSLRAADLVVLRSPDMPSVLFEAGFVTNEEDAARLTSPEWKSGFADAMARAIRIYFVRQGGG